MCKDKGREGCRKMDL
jgi:hypothetical protein